MDAKDREVSATKSWGIGIIVTIAIASASFFVQLGIIQNQVEQNSADIEKTEQRLDNVNEDIVAILVGIEQVKARLGIVEIQ